MNRKKRSCRFWNMIRQYLRDNPHAYLVLLLPIYLITYFTVEHFVSEPNCIWLVHVPLDDKLPFLEGFVIPYAAWYPLLVAVGLPLLIKDGPAFRRYMLFLMVGFFSALAFCVLVPNYQNLRPQVMPRDNFCTKILTGFIYAADNNANVFPSMHVIGSVGAVLGVLDSKVLKKWRVPVILLAILISVSTVFVKQHSCLDVIGGLAWCIPLWFAFYFPAYRKRKVS